MKFLLIASFPDSLVLFRGPLIDALLAHGLQVHVAAPDLATGSAVRQFLENKGVHTHDIPLQRTGINPLADARTLFHLWKLMRVVRPNFVLGYTIKPVIYGLLAARLAHVPKRFALITGLGYSFQGDGRRSVLRKLVQRLYSFALRGVNTTFFQNPDDEALFRRLKILQPLDASLVVHGSGVNIDYYAVAPLPAAPRFLLIARLLGDKGIREYAQAAQRIRSLYPEVVFGLVGWVDENPNSVKQRELDAWVAEGTLEFAGRLSDVRPAIAACSVYVLPSYREGMPRTVLEAMAMGRPIITTDAPGCRETIRNGENGCLVPVRSVDALVAAMLRFINEPALAQSMGKRSRQIAESIYDVRKINAVMLNEMGIY
ncbi:MAG: glycosyltransferase family 4 protein [Burkholderiaceae bacterium]